MCPEAPGLAVSGLVIAFPGAGTVLTVPELSVPGGTLLAVEGPSGAGKTSLLHVLAGLERPAQGTVRWGGQTVWPAPAAARDRWRRRCLGLVFQDIHLVDGMSALDNVLLPILFGRLAPTAAERAEATDLLARLGVDRPARTVTAMSRGERQRVALARALLPGVPLLLADEPTASLDQSAAASLGALLFAQAAARRATLLVVSHDPALLDRAPRRMRLAGGTLEPCP